MDNLEALQETAKAAIAAKKELDQRIADNKDNWNATSNTVKDAWSALELAPREFKVGQTVFTCSKEGITNDTGTEAARDPQTLGELQSSIGEYLYRIRANYDERMQP